MPLHLRPDAAEIVEALNAEKLVRLFHFTSIDNLPSIRDAGGLASKGTLAAQSLWPCACPGGNEISHSLDHHHDNWEKVNFNFTPWTPMVYRKKQEKHLCFFVVSNQVAGREGVVFTSTNATANGHLRAEGLDGLKLLDPLVLRSLPMPWDPTWKPKVQAEVLVPHLVELDLVKGVAFLSEASLEEAERLWGGASHPPFKVIPKFFSDRPGQGSAVLGFPYLKAASLTDDSSVYADLKKEHAAMTVIQRTGGGGIFLIAKLYATAGCRAEVIWHPCGDVEEVVFPVSDHYTAGFDLEQRRLADGPASVELWLNAVRWATIEFTLVS